MRPTPEGSSPPAFLERCGAVFYGGRFLYTGKNAAERKGAAAVDIKALAQTYEAYIVERRRYYHANPELSGQEEQTRRQIRKDLEAMGITEITELRDCFGMTAMLRGGRPGRTVALRADIDALPVREASGLPFASTNGCMHACGHDSHIAMLLGAARILQDVRAELAGNVKLIFQPAEEIAAGAGWMLREHALKGVDALYGAHIWGTLDAPLVDVSPGNRMACSHRFTIRVEGRSAHGSAPHLGLDPIMVACTIATSLQQCVSRMNDPLNPLVLTIASIHGGSCWNVIPGEAVMEGTVRTFLKGDQVEHQMRRIVTSTAEAFGTAAQLEYEYKTPPVINEDPQLNRIARGAAVKLYGEEAVGCLPPLMSSEDFSILGTQVPSAFAFVGGRNREKGIVYTNHHEAYTVDEDVLQRGAAVMAQFAADYLAETAL